MNATVTITFKLDTADYSDCEGTVESATELVRAFLREEADWPFEFDDHYRLCDVDIQVVPL